MDNIYRRVSFMKTEVMRGRADAAVVFLNDRISDGLDIEEDRVMRNILEGAESADVYGRVCALIGHVIGEKYKTSNQKLVYEMVTGEKLEETKKA